MLCAPPFAYRQQSFVERAQADNTRNVWHSGTGSKATRRMWMWNGHGNQELGGGRGLNRNNGISGEDPPYPASSSSCMLPLCCVEQEMNFQQGQACMPYAQTKGPEGNNSIQWRHLSQWMMQRGAFLSELHALSSSLLLFSNGAGRQSARFAASP
jgi:hypothetical protein